MKEEIQTGEVPCWYKDDAGDYYFSSTRYIVNGTFMSCKGGKRKAYYEADEQTPLIKVPWRAIENLRIYFRELDLKENYAPNYTAVELNDRIGYRTLDPWK